VINEQEMKSIDIMKLHDPIREILRGNIKEQQIRILDLEQLYKYNDRTR
jgi:hypothetical protein